MTHSAASPLPSQVKKPQSRSERSARKLRASKAAQCAVQAEDAQQMQDADAKNVKQLHKFADANICLYGAHITGYRPMNSMDILWMSPESTFEEGKAIRGGIPVCFPWFGLGFFGW